MTIHEARRLLGIQANNLNDEQIQKLLQNFYALAEVVADAISSHGSKNKPKGIEVVKQGGDNGTS